MDITILRSGVTVSAFIAFVAIIVWAYQPRNKARFERAAALPLQADEEARHA
jgi:cbb3-type cytochrome oxidase subunit 3